MNRLSVSSVLLIAALPSLAGGATPSRRPSAPQVAQTDLFDFHSELLLNMHHALMRWGIAGPWSDLSALPPTVRVQAEDLATFDPDGDLGKWGQPVSYYYLMMSKRDLVFDPDMVALRDCLSIGGPSCGAIAPKDKETVQFLEHYQPLYEQLFWQRHDLVNRAWILSQLPALERFEHTLAERIAAAYGGTWPPGRSRVDVSFYANEVGGYTTSDGHIVVSSNEIGNQGHLGLELLFHEASHGATLERPLRAMIEKAFAAAAAEDGVEAAAEPPPDFWHLVIFYTAGHLTRQVLEEADIPYLQTFAEFSGLWADDEDHRLVKSLLDARWEPALTAGEGFDAAMLDVARAWVDQRH